jgi:AI-2 transport protein TqsA
MSEQQRTVGLPRGLLILLGTAAATITIAGLRSISAIVAPIFLALMLIIAVYPLRPWLRRKGLPSWAATLCTLVAVYAMVLGLALMLMVALARFATLLPQYRDELAVAVEDVLAWLQGLGVGIEQIEVMSRALDPGQLISYVGALLTGLLGVLSDLFFLVTLLLFLAIDATWFPDRLNEAAQRRGGLVTALKSFAAGTRRYLVVCTIFGLIVAVVDTGLLYMLAIPVPVLWGLLAFITNYIPNIGFVIGLVPPALLAVLEGGAETLVAVLVGYSVINVVIQSFIQPMIVGDAVGLSTTMTFVSLVFWAWVFGALGALLAIPLSLLAKALLVDVDPASDWLRPLLGGRAQTVTTDAPQRPLTRASSWRRTSMLRFDRSGRRSPLSGKAKPGVPRKG